MPTISNSRSDIVSTLFTDMEVSKKCTKIVKNHCFGKQKWDIGGGWHVGEWGINGIFKIINIINIFNSTYVYIIFDKKIK